MYNYSPIKTLRVKNFRNIGDVQLDFTESPIVTLVGKNESGKTSIVKAFETCALHANPREQKDWIRDNTNMFGVQIDLQDGTQVVRIKQDGGINMYKVIYPDGHEWDVSKLTEGLPYEVQRLMGLIEEPETKEYLHVRTYEDKLLFIVTPSSTNYKVMYNALKVEQLTKAIKQGSNEINELKSKIDRNDLNVQTLNTQLKAINILDITSLTAIRDRLKQQTAILNKLKQAVQLSKQMEYCRNELGVISIIERFNLQSIDEVLSMRLTSASNIFDNLSKLKIKAEVLSKVGALEEIDTRTCDKLASMIQRKDELGKKKEEATVFNNLSKTSEIDEGMVIHLSKAEQLLKSSLSLKSELNTVNQVQSLGEIDTTVISKLESVMQKSANIETAKAQYEEIIAYIEQVNDYLKKVGVAVESCPRCGEAVIFDIDKLNDLVTTA